MISSTSTSRIGTFLCAAAAPVHVRCFSTKFDIFGDSPVPDNKKRFVPTSGTYPKGFRVGSINAGIKPASKSQPDLALVESQVPSCGAAVFTRNEFPAASITVSREVLQRTKGHELRGVIANSWCANTLTGQAGLNDTTTMSRVAEEFILGQPGKADGNSVMVMHTGMGAQRLPINDIVENIPKLYQGMGNSHGHWLDAARALCTTDTFPKLTSRTFTLPSSPDTTFSIAGITKGAGMVHPNMATTLGIICTDAAVQAPALQRLLSVAADKSYNCISIDGDTSTNDMVTMFANGAATSDHSDEVAVDYLPSAAASEQSADFIALQRILIEFMADMAKLVVRDGEGASKFITIRIRGSPSYGAAKHIASVIARSVLVKAAIYGKEPSWGGVLAALGYSLLDTPFAGKGIIVPEMTSVSFVDSSNGELLKFLDKGVPAAGDGTRAKHVMAEEDVEIVVDLRDDGKDAVVEESVYWTCDLTHDFVTINSDFGN